MYIEVNVGPYVYLFALKISQTKVESQWLDALHVYLADFNMNVYSKVPSRSKGNVKHYTHSHKYYPVRPKTPAANDHESAGL